MSNPYKDGKLITREEWEKNHKPTCRVYPCANWREIHWHLSDMKIFDVASAAPPAKKADTPAPQEMARPATYRGESTTPSLYAHGV